MQIDNHKPLTNYVWWNKNYSLIFSKLNFSINKWFIIDECIIDLCHKPSGELWGRSGRARGRPQHRLCVEGQLFLLQLRQELLLQRHGDAVRNLHRPVVGLWVRLHYFLHGVVHHPLPEILLHHDGLSPEVLRHLYHVLFGANLWDLWPPFQ